MSYEAFEFTVADGVAHVVWNQPERGNPIDETFCRELAAIAVECDGRPEVRAVLMEARGRHFSVGGDLKSFVRDRDSLPRFVKHAAGLVNGAVSRLARMDAPLVMVCHSLVTGGAVGLTAAADFALAPADSRFYAAFTGIGFSCDCGTSYHLPRRVGTRRAFEFLVRNQTWSATQALGYGLVNEVLPDEELARARGRALAAELAVGPTRAYGEIKRLFASTFEQPLEAQLEAEARAIAKVSASDDCWQAFHAVLAKQKPEFRGR